MATEQSAVQGYDSGFNNCALKEPQMDGRALGMEPQ